MKELKPTDRSESWLVVINGVAYTGITNPGQVTNTNAEVFETGPEHKIAAKLANYQRQFPSSILEEAISDLEVELEAAEEGNKLTLQDEIDKLKQELIYAEGFRVVRGKIRYYVMKPTQKAYADLALVQTITVTLLE